ncbi:MAG: tail fiber domain-containing protein, partial [Candidatus Margulisiibacteriota bacterium]
MLKNILLTILIILSLATAALAVANPITYSGRLLKYASSGHTSQAMDFQLYNDPTAGTLLWQQLAVNVTLDHGVYTISLPVSPNVLADNSNIYIQITAGSETIAPRTKLNLVNYALQAGGLLAGNGQQAVAVSTNGNVGIGITAPSAKLEVAGTVSANNYLKNGVAIAGSGYSLDSSDGSVQNALYVTRNGSVGIGTSAPYGKLSLLGGTLTIGNTGFYSNRNWQYSSYDSANSKGVAIGYVPDNNGNAIQGIASGTNGNLLLNPYDGNVGIGTTSPSSKLEVSASANAGTIVRVSNGDAMDASAFSGIQFYQGSSFRGAINSINDGNSASIGGPKTLQLWNYVNGNMIFGTNNTERMRIGVDGNVGIGTTNPNIGGFNTAGTVLTIAAKSSGGATGLELNGKRVSTGGISTQIDFYSNSGETPFSSIHALRGVTDTANGVIVLQPNGGSVGISVTNPVYRLQVSGNIGNETFPIANTTGFGYAPGTYKVLQIGASGTNKSIALGLDPSTITGGNFSGTNMLIIPKGGSVIAPDLAGTNWSGVLRPMGDRTYFGGVLTSGELDGSGITVVDNGYVGIGTTSPGARLEVAGTVSANNFIKNGAVFAGDGYSLDSVDGSVPDALYVTKNGNVGIGTSTPLSQLHIYAPGSIGNGELRVGGDIPNYGIVVTYNQYGGTIGAIYSNMNYNNSAALLKLGVNANNNPNQLVLLGNGNIGIGTAAPESKLTVVSNNGTASFVPNDEGTWKIAELFSDATGGSTSSARGLKFGYVAGTKSSAIVGTAENNTGGISGLAFLTALGNQDFERVRINSAGYVGIGTTAPASRLSVQQASEVALGSDGAEGIRVYNSAKTSFVQIQMNNRGAELSSSAPGGGVMLPLFLNTSRAGVPPITVSQNGYVGIGMSNPSVHLDVTGIVQSTVSSGYNFIANKAGGANILFYGTGKNNAMVEASNASNALLFYTNTVADAGLTERMRIDNAGNVGIGTVSPTNGKLEIAKNVAGGLETFLHLSNINDSYRGGLLSVNGVSGAGNFMVGTDGSAYNLLFGINNVEKMRVNANGRVGIGVSNPSANLVVYTGYGTRESNNNIFMAFEGGMGSDTSGMIVFNDTIATQAGTNTMFHIHQKDAVNGSLFRVSGGGTLSSPTNEGLTVKADGKVGIGTTAPGANLEIKRSGDARIIINQPDTTPYTATLELSSQGLGTYGGLLQYDASAEAMTLSNYGRSNSSTTQGAIRFRTKLNNTTTTDVVYINGYSGNVGIGMTNPGSILELYQSTTHPKLTITAPNTSGVGSQSYLSLKTGTATPKIWDIFADYDSGKLFISNPAGGSNNRLVIDSVGNVGIGTSAPGYRLQVGVAGDGSEARANAWNSLSDIRLKTNLVRMNSALEKISRLNGYYFDWKQGADKSRQIGVIAQEVETVV